MNVPGEPSGRALAVRPAARVTEEIVDELLEASVIGSFSSVGIAVRRGLARRFGAWDAVADMADKVVVVTGGTSGIGLAAADILARAGAHLHLVGRDPARAEQARAQVQRSAGIGGRSAAVQSTLADLADPDAVVELASTLRSSYDAIDVLVHGAGVLSRRFGTGPDGTETTAAVHLLAPFLLTGLVRPLLAAAGAARVVTVTSGGMYTQGFDLDRLVCGPDGYDGTVAYARAKRAQVVLTGQWARMLAGDQIVCHAMHPGWVDTPGLRSGLPGFAALVSPLLRTPADGADTVAWLASAPAAAATSGDLWHDRRRRSPYRLPWTWVPPATRVAQGSALERWCAGHRAWNPAARGGG